MPTKARRGAAKAADPRKVLDLLRESHGEYEAPQLRDTLDFLLYSHLVATMPLAAAARAFAAFQAQFVDWNEVRISTAREVQEILKKAPEPLELALFLKEFLNRLFLEHHHVGCEFLREMSNNEIKGFFKKTPGITELTVRTALETIRGYPILPVGNDTLALIERLGWSPADATPLQKLKDSHMRIPAEDLRDMSHHLTEHVRLHCSPDVESLRCTGCPVRRICPYPSKKSGRATTKSKA